MKEELKPIKLANEEIVVCKAVSEDKKEYYVYLSGKDNSVQIFEDTDDIWSSYIMTKGKVIENQINIAKFIAEWNKTFKSKTLTKVVIIPITHVVLSTKRNVVIGKGALLSIERSMSEKEDN